VYKWKSVIRFLYDSSGDKGNPRRFKSRISGS